VTSRLLKEEIGSPRRQDAKLRGVGIVVVFAWRLGDLSSCLGCFFSSLPGQKMKGFVVWLTGLSGTGKTTLAAVLLREFVARGLHVEVLDGDEVRAHLGRGLGFSREDRDTNVRRIGYVARLVARAGAAVIVAAISPYRSTRDEQRAAVRRFVEVYCTCPLPVLMARDPKGLYRKALAGEIQQFTGIDDPYEPPISPEVVVATDVESEHESGGKILRKLEALGYLPPPRT
jgi:adenylyl-sulfate kinase